MPHKTVCAYPTISDRVRFLDRLRRRLASRGPLPEANWGAFARIWANSEWALLGFAYLLFALVLPGNGSPFRLCLFHNAFGVDCPGCGMTRALSNLWRGNFSSAVQFHPFSLVVFPALFLHAASLAMAEPLRRGMVDWMNRNNRFLWIFTAVVVVAFFTFGFARAAVQTYDLLFR